MLLIDGTCDGESGKFLVAVGEAAHRKHRFEAGMELSGSSAPVEDERKETASLYKTSGIKVVKKAEGEAPAGPPFLGAPPDLETCRERGHRRLAARSGRSPGGAACPARRRTGWTRRRPPTAARTTSGSRGGGSRRRQGVAARNGAPV